MKFFEIDSHLTAVLDVPSVVAMWAWANTGALLCGKYGDVPVTDNAAMATTGQRFDALISAGADSVNGSNEAWLVFQNDVVLVKREYGVLIAIIAKPEVNGNALRFMLTLFYRKLAQAMHSGDTITGSAMLRTAVSVPASPPPGVQYVNPLPAYPPPNQVPPPGYLPAGYPPAPAYYPAVLPPGYGRPTLPVPPPPRPKGTGIWG